MINNLTILKSQHLIKTKRLKYNNCIKQKIYRIKKHNKAYQSFLINDV